ncbi:uncharacterized protein LOC113382079 [Ctenocephalides felis]|uniref:uncharacterized protein LOC113382079 n=1 Tax=Ctenocephalides felis TaxID=7515 RepID=UPI000E6E3939|nr:uncharacterized protein LOC113382079 [Ctenocephalides felis]
MPRRNRPDIGRRSQITRQKRNSRNNRTDGQMETDNNDSQIAMTDLLEFREQVAANRSQQQRARENETSRIRRNYSAHKFVKIGDMSIICQHCKALKYNGESAGLCCAGGKVKLPQLVPPPDPLHSLIFGMTNDSKHFLSNIQKYNNCFQMTSFGATHIVQNNFIPTFKVQGQIHHLLGALLPLPDADHQFLQIYFLGNQDVKLIRVVLIIHQ